MTEQEIIYTMALTRVPRVNTAAQHRLMEEAGSASAVFDHRHHIRDFYPEASDKLSAALQEMEVQVARATARNTGKIFAAVSWLNWPISALMCWW